MSLIVYSIPVFFLLIGVEIIITRMRGLSYYRFNDAITNLSCGIGSQVTGVFMKFLTFGVYVIIFNASPLRGKIPYNYLTIALLFLGVDFFYYWFHRLAHEVSVMWGSHVVHHQSEEYNLTVALRQAWVQGAFSWVFYLPLAFVGHYRFYTDAVPILDTYQSHWQNALLV
jgi:alkylglycerol monooxygenase